MTDLTEFLLARIAEDEFDARRAVGLGLASRLMGQADQVVARYGSQEPPDEPNTADRLWWTAQDVHQWLTPHGPARVLADCKAKRRIASTMQSAINGGWQSQSREEIEFVATRTLRALALPYADHPAYREDWTS